MDSPSLTTPPPGFSSYQRFVIGVLVFLHFTIILDFMILSPLGAILLTELGVTARQFGLVVSAYAISAGISGLLAAGFADRFDRKKLLLFFYTGFVLGTLLCGVAPNYHVLLIARIVTGIFGGVIGAVSFAIIADLFPYTQRGRVMGLVQAAFAGSQVLGIPIGLYLATHYGWHAPFLMIGGVSVVVGVVIFARLQPVVAHLKAAPKRNPLQHLWDTAARPRYQIGFAATMLLAVGGFMLMPFSSAFSVHNLGIPLEKLPMIYMITGLSALVSGPVLGRLSDRYGKYLMFCCASTASIVLVLYYTRLGTTPITTVIFLNVILFASISGRMVSAGALGSAIPELADRGAYMSISSSLQQFAGGAASFAAGLIVVQSPSGIMQHYPRLGVVVAVATGFTIVLMYRVHRLVNGKQDAPVVPAAAAHQAE